jgi:hypothetical protein
MAEEAAGPYQDDAPSLAGHPRPVTVAAAALGAELGRRMLDQGAGELIGRESI